MYFEMIEHAAFPFDDAATVSAGGARKSGVLAGANAAIPHGHGR
jgi:hypothetical protein